MAEEFGKTLLEKPPLPLAILGLENTPHVSGPVWASMGAGFGGFWGFGRAEGAT